MTTVVELDKATGQAIKAEFFESPGLAMPLVGCLISQSPKNEIVLADVSQILREVTAK